MLVVVLLAVLALFVLLSPWLVVLAFFALCTAKRLLASGIALKWWMRAPCYLALAIGFPADIVFNKVFGPRLFDGDRRGRTFSDRIEHYYRHPEDCPDPTAYAYWFGVLEGGDPGHVTGLTT